MKAAVFEKFQSPLQVREVPDVTPHPDAVVIAVEACGICRSDWHGWMGHDSDVTLPHVPGHELAGRIVTMGDRVRSFEAGQRVTAPFCCGCDHCEQCASGNQQICDHYTQPGFTQWGAFAELVEIRYADVNLVLLPDELDFVTAASLGCRFATSFRGVVEQGRVSAGDWVAVHGCGGVGLSAVMIANAIGANVIAVDVRGERLNIAKQCGAAEAVSAATTDVVNRIRQITQGGAHVSIDALGSHETCSNSIRCLRKRGRHVQIGLMLGAEADPRIPMGQVIAGELEIYGSHGLQAYDYGRMFRMIAAGQVNPRQLITDCVSLEQAAEILPRMHEFPGDGVTVIDSF
jgi:alcohol dehydrogenase